MMWEEPLVSRANAQLTAFLQKRAREEVDLVAGAVVIRPGISPGPGWSAGSAGIHPERGV